MKKCQPEDEDCTKARHTLIATIGQVKSTHAQKLLVNDVIKRDPDEEDLKVALFHLSVQDEPIKVL